MDLSFDAGGIHGDKNVEGGPKTGWIRVSTEAALRR